MLARGGRYEFPVTSGMSYSRRILEQVMPISVTEHGNCTDGYLHVVVPFLTPISTIDEPLSFYRLHSTNTHGGGTPRRLIGVKMLDHRKRLRDREFSLFRQLAEAHHLTIPADASPCTADDHFDELLLDRATTRRLGLRGRIGLALTILRLMRKEETPFAGILRQAIVLAIVCVAPRFVLRRIYVNLFTG
jgi:hypothetical protein